MLSRRGRGGNDHAPEFRQIRTVFPLKKQVVNGEKPGGWKGSLFSLVQA